MLLHASMRKWCATIRGRIASAMPLSSAAVLSLMVAACSLFFFFVSASFTLVPLQSKDAMFYHEATSPDVIGAAKHPPTWNASLLPQRGLWPFRHAKRNMPVNDLLGMKPRNAAAVCELMVLGNPSCDAFLTGEAVWSHPDGPMVECIMGNGGVEAWDRVLQPQCSKSPFWQRFKAKYSTKKHHQAFPSLRDRPQTKNVPVMDPIMKMHVGPMEDYQRYVPPSRRSPTPYHPPLTCHGPTPSHKGVDRDLVQRLHDQRLVDDRVAVGKALSFSMVELDDETDEAVRAGTLPPREGGPLRMYPIGFGMGPELMVRRPYRYKLYGWFPLAPSYFPIAKPQLFKSFPKRFPIPTSSVDEFTVLMVMRLSYFGWTHARGGPECLRHYELLSAGCMPYFIDLPLMANWSVSGLPRTLLLQAQRLRGVDHIPMMDSVVPVQDIPVYRQDVMPKAVAQRRRDDMHRLMRRRLARNQRHAEEDALLHDLSSLLGEHERAELTASLQDEALQSLTEPLSRPQPRVEPYFSATRNAFVRRLQGETVFNFLKWGNIKRNVFDEAAYFRLLDQMHRFTVSHLTNGAVAAYMLRVLNAEAPKRILFFASEKVDYLSNSLLRGLAELGLPAEVCVLPNLRTKAIFGSKQPLHRSSNVVLRMDSMREFGPEGAQPEMTGSMYHAWRVAHKLDFVYGKNFAVGYRTPKRRRVSASDACRGIAAGLYDVVVLGYAHWQQRFDFHVCAKALRERDRSRVQVAYVMGHDWTPVETVRTYHEEGIVTFVREPQCW